MIRPELVESFMRAHGGRTPEEVLGPDYGPCEAFEWPTHTGATESCPNRATHTEHWFDEEGIEVPLCEDHRQDG